MSQSKRFEIEWGGKTLSIETGVFAQQANGSCLVQYGDTVVLATATMGESDRQEIDFFPLMVDYEEKFYAAGRIKGSRFIKSEGRPSDEAILISRFIDRAIRPLFSKDLRRDVQIVVTCLAYDGENAPDIIGLLAASCALHISDIPWNGPIADIRVGQIEGEFVINPTHEARKKSLFDLSFAGTPEKIIMVEAIAKEAKEQDILNAFWFGQKHLNKPIQLLEEVKKEIGKTKQNFEEDFSEKQKESLKQHKEIENLIRPFVVEQTKEHFFKVPQASKAQRRKAKNTIKTQTEQFLNEQSIDKEIIASIPLGTLVEKIIESEVSRSILEEDHRVDGRGLKEIRPLFHEVGILPRVHGSSHFKRGETQVISIVTLGSPGDEQTLDSMEKTGTKRYIHHYNFPPFSVGEAKPMRGPGRRDIGHGALAERALLEMIPDKESFPYTIRVVSEVLGSNGSSSMASTCASALALMDAGVPIKKAVAGVAMGLAFNEKTNQWKIITDLQDLEDGEGGMDFKITGTKDGITAIQMDTKTTGLNKEIVEQTIKQAYEGRLQILESMEKTIASPREDLSPYAPRIITLRINPERIGEIIGPGGKIINEIISTTGVQGIDIEDDGLVMITSIQAEAAKKAYDWIKQITYEPKVGEIFKAKVIKIMDFGAFVEFLPKQEGLVHISAIAPWRVEKVSDILQVGEEVWVKIIGIDDIGRVNLSMKEAPGNTYPEGEGASKKAPGKNQKPFAQNHHEK
ncbi:polyribonucleotide nucleotidyltransferase [Candidatus Uhrbacteria bacterium CG_4_9_14_3_um_filter_36_7]|uniref:Polyribonucleotide nucleotidyltransferase n=1 Tax=Candidatus Uhrbacteria bacterium CG_4_9_14_3_um_filter_36_7 TaxID=1975033 RepID=A0A2M7XI42_9BACT|nr:MAG: polyribonucleotide nucleotidyltransferase [Candidatus Uhrbacteria bacterium CG_4_9_14_3_um_filter_36_7]